MIDQETKDLCNQLLSKKMYQVDIERTMSHRILVISENGKKAEKLAKEITQDYMERDFEDGDDSYSSFELKDSFPNFWLKCELELENEDWDLISKISSKLGYEDRILTVQEYIDFISFVKQKTIIDFKDPNQMELNVEG